MTILRNGAARMIAIEVSERELTELALPSAFGVLAYVSVTRAYGVIKLTGSQLALNRVADFLSMEAE